MTTQTIEKDIKGLKQVKDQYEDYPYPYRDPEEEKNRLLIAAGDYLGEINHWLYNGKESFDSGFRILVAGGGTGDASTYYTEQLKGRNAEIVYLDFSKASLEIAKRRAEIRGATNIKFIHDSILEIPNLNLGKFDLINCFGVLHHLESPDTGLKILRDSLKDTGGMHLMIYGKYGRTGLYTMQDAMKMVNDGVNNRAQEVANTKTILSNLPTTNWFARSQELMTDHIHYGDIGIYDMFLHKQDRAYSVTEMYDYVEKQGLNFVDFSDIGQRIGLKIENFVRDISLLERLKTKSLRDQYAISEILLGNQIKHSFYVSAKKDSVATMDDLDNIPYFYNMPPDTGKDICKMMKESNIGPGMMLTMDITNNWRIKDAKIQLPVSEFTYSLFENIGSEAKTIGQIIETMRKKNPKQNVTDDILLNNEVKRSLAPFIATGIMLLRHKSAKAI